MKKLKYIDYNKIFKKIGYTPFKGQHILIMNANRSIGKTTGIINFALEECKSNPNFKFAYGRYSTIELENFIKNFNASYSPDFKSDGLNIFLYGYKYSDTKPVNSDNKLLSGWEYDEELKKYKKWDKIRSCGMVVNISTPSNFLSMNVGCVNLFVFDEYNDFVDKRGIFTKFTELLATLQRNNDNMFVLLLGNRRNANNEFMVRFGINPNLLKYDGDDDLYIKVNDEISFIDINPVNFSNNGIGLSKTLSAFDEKLNNYYNNGGYLSNSDVDVINYNLFIKDYITKKLFILIINNIKYEVGFFAEKKVYITSEYIDNTLNVFALRNRDNVNSSSHLLENPKEIINFLFNNLKHNNLFFNSFDTRIDIIDELTWGTSYLGDDVNEY